MTSSNGNTFRITGPLWGESTGPTGDRNQWSHWWPVDSPHIGQWRRALMFSLICASTNCWANNRNTCEWRCHNALYGVTVMMSSLSYVFLAATKQLYKWYFPSVCPSVCPSVRLSVCPSHLFDYVPIIVSSWNFQELLPMTNVRSMQKVKVRGQRSRSQRSQPNLTVSGL